MVDIFNYYGLKLNHNKALCPFHKDSNPSLSIKRDTNVATCFSCGATGNVISFVQKYEKLVNHNDITVNEAIAKVVDICNLNIDVSRINKQSYDNRFILSNRRYTDEEKKMIEVNETLARLFHYNLTAIDEHASKYLNKRKIDNKQIEELNLGFSEKGQLLKIKEDNKNYPRSLLIKLGYLKYDKQGNLQETFANRIMIPIHDEKGNIVTFCGRTITDEKPKYLHTSENELFHKRELLYNYHNAKLLAYNNELIIVEGYMDAMGARNIGYENVVASMGVAITSEQLKLIKKNRSSITLALDNDNAGHDAMIKAIPELLNQGFKVNVIDISNIGDYKDFGDLSENNISLMEVQSAKISGFAFMLKYKYFKDQVLNVENISFAFKKLKEDKLITNTYDESLFKEYLLLNTDFNKSELDEIMYPKKIEEKENVIDNFASKAMINFLYMELLDTVDKKNDKVLSFYFNSHKATIEKRLIEIFNVNPDKYLDYSTSSLNQDKLLYDFLQNNKDYSDYESINRFKYLNVFDKTYIKNSSGSARIKLKDNQIQSVIKQYESSLSDQAKLALEEVEELYIINSIDDIDGILSYNNKTLDIIKENIKERLFLNKNKMDFFKFGNLFLNVDKEFIDSKFKGSTGNFKTILFYNNLDNNLMLDRTNVVNNDEVIHHEQIVSKEETKEIEKKEDFVFSINKVLLYPDMETDTDYFVRIPNTEAKEYMFIPKEECDWKDSDELFYTSLKYDKSYPIYNKKGEYLYDKSCDELKVKWEDKTKNKNSPSSKIIQESNEKSEDKIIYDNTYTSKYKEPISKIYKSKIYLETEKGFYIRTDDPNVLLFAVKKICNWTEDKSYLIVSPKKGIFNCGISKYSLNGFKKSYVDKLSYNEIKNYLKLFYPNDFKKKEKLLLNVPKKNCSFKSNFVEIPLTIDNVSGYISVNIIKTKIDEKFVKVEFDSNEQVGFHNKNGDYVNHFGGSKICNSYNDMLVSNNIIEFPSTQLEEQSIPIYEKEAA